MRLTNYENDRIDGMFGATLILAVVIYWVTSARIENTLQFKFIPIWVLVFVLLGAAWYAYNKMFLLRNEDATQVIATTFIVIVLWTGVLSVLLFDTPAEPIWWLKSVPLALAFTPITQAIVYQMLKGLLWVPFTKVTVWYEYDEKSEDILTWYKTSFGQKVCISWGMQLPAYIEKALRQFHISPEHRERSWFNLEKVTFSYGLTWNKLTWKPVWKS